MTGSRQNRRLIQFQSPDRALDPGEDAVPARSARGDCSPSGKALTSQRTPNQMPSTSTSSCTAGRAFLQRAALFGSQYDFNVCSSRNAQNCVKACPMNIPLTRAIYEENRETLLCGLLGAWWFEEIASPFDLKVALVSVS